MFGMDGRYERLEGVNAMIAADAGRRLEDMHDLLGTGQGYERLEDVNDFLAQMEDVNDLKI